jgi:hypothetical protein
VAALAPAANPQFHAFLYCSCSERQCPRDTTWLNQIAHEGFAVSARKFGISMHCRRKISEEYRGMPRHSRLQHSEVSPATDTRTRCIDLESPATARPTMATRSKLTIFFLIFLNDRQQLVAY